MFKYLISLSWVASQTSTHFTPALRVLTPETDLDLVSRSSGWRVESQLLFFESGEPLLMVADGQCSPVFSCLFNLIQFSDYF